MIDDFSLAKSIYNQLPISDKKLFSLYGGDSFTACNNVVLRICQKSGFIELSNYNDGYLYIAIVVLPQYRGTGVANMLLNNAIYSSDRPLRYVVNKNNKRSTNFIRKRNDFKLIEENQLAFIFERELEK